MQIHGLPISLICNSGKQKTSVCCRSQDDIPRLIVSMILVVTVTLNYAVRNPLYAPVRMKSFKASSSSSSVRSAVRSNCFAWSPNNQAPKSRPTPNHAKYPSGCYPPLATSAPSCIAYAKLLDLDPQGKVHSMLHPHIRNRQPYRQHNQRRNDRNPTRVHRELQTRMRKRERRGLDYRSCPVLWVQHMACIDASY